MEIVLLQDVKSLGKKGQVVKKVKEDKLLDTLRQELLNWKD